MLKPAIPLLVLACALPAWADEGMWTLDNPPLARIEKAYGSAPSKDWLRQAMRASARLAAGCSGSFVSKDGLVLTNHHCAAACVEHLSSAGNNLLEKGFLAATGAQERQCPAMEVDRLERITDVTDKVAAATAGLDGTAYKDARNAIQAKLNSECVGTDGSKVRCDVVDFYHGGQYKLYRYHRFQDVRLVFAPEKAVAFFGGDPDNFNFPRFDLDMSVVRVYEDGHPAAVADYFPFDAKGPSAGELVYVIGHPGRTQRELTVAQLATLRDLVLPDVLLRLSEYRGVLEEYASTGAEPARYAAETLFRVENGFKGLRGRFDALLDPTLFQRKQDEEAALRRFAASRPELAGQTDGAWDAIERAEARLREIYRLQSALESGNPFATDYFAFARTLVRGAAERPLANGKRLPEFADSALPEVEARLFSSAPIHPEFEKLRLTFALTKLRESLGADHPVVRRLLGRESPAQLAARLVDGTRLADVEERRRLWNGGQAAIDASDDPMVRFAAALDPDARAVRKRYEAEVESVEQKNSERIARARFAQAGTEHYPDATFTLRLSYGAVKGWTENGGAVAPFTTLGGAFDRATGADPYRLPDSWLAAKDRLDLATPLNFATDNDIIGGNSGSPVVDAKGHLVGLIFDGNLPSLGGAFWFDERVNRAVAVDSAAILEALDRIYRAPGLAGELRGN
jgi:hypothetical protein